MGKKISLLLLTIVLALGAGLWAWSLFQNEVRVVSDIADELKNIDVDISAKDVKLSHGENGRVNWELSARSANFDQDTGATLVEEPKVTYYLEGGEEKVYLSAPSGRVNQKNNTMSMSPDVKIVYGDTHIQGDLLEYEGERKKIFLRGNVRINRSDASVESKLLTVDLDKSEVVASDGVVFTANTNDISANQ